MPQAFAKIIVHITFSTKNREPLITKNIQSELYAYLAEICNAMECYAIKIGGYTDHVHILCFLSKKITLIKLVEEVKKRSSKWIKSKGEAFEAFFWQNGYGAFSIHHSQVEMLKKYIENQEEHHAKTHFKDEYIRLLKKNEMEYDEKYIWD
ncbi:MAG: IS200/IS605 family transposase [Sphingobacteriales bacterium]|nr:MAG: IS200/IS605 family transposase [Sphingobacteriales bacterium]